MHHFNVLEWIGLIVMLFGQLMILVQAFQRSVGWGLAVLFLPGIVSLIFVLVNWKQSGYWFFFALAGFLIVMIF